MTTGSSTTTVRQQVEDLIATDVSRFLDSHVGTVEVVSVTDAGDVTLRFAGACNACPALPVTFESAVKPRLMAIPGVRTVTTERVNISNAAAARVAALFAPRPRATRVTETI